MSIAERGAAAEVEAAACSIASWNEWCDEALNNGCGRMHRHTAIQLPWVPYSTLQRNGVVTADPQVMLQALADELQPLWLTDVIEPAPFVPDRDCLPRVSTDAIVRASKIFAMSTSIVLDGFHCRHVAPVT